MVDSKESYKFDLKVKKVKISLTKFSLSKLYPRN